MKVVFTMIALLFSASVLAACPSIDDTIAMAKKGRATSMDVQHAILCQYPTCDFKLLVLTNNVTHTVELLNVGEKTREDVANAAGELAAAKIACTK